MNSVRARVTAAFLVRSPLTSSAFSKSLGSMERLVAMCQPPHMILHTVGQGSSIRFPQDCEIGEGVTGTASLVLSAGNFLLSSPIRAGGNRVDLRISHAFVDRLRDARKWPQRTIRSRGSRIATRLF